MFIAALFTIARMWKQPRCPSANKWIRKLWYKDTMEYYSAMKKNAFESVLMRWMNIQPINHLLYMFLRKWKKKLSESSDSSPSFCQFKNKQEGED